MSEALIKRLRSEGDGVMSRREKSQIADLIEQLEAERNEHLRDLKAMRKWIDAFYEIEAERDELIGMRAEMLEYQKEFHRLRDQLAASQQRKKVLRDGLTEANSQADRIEQLEAENDALRTGFAELRSKVFTNGDRSMTMDGRTFTVEGDGLIFDNNFDFDATIRVFGDFVDDQKRQYSEMIAEVLNSRNARREFSDELRKAAKTEQELRAHVELMRGLLEWAKGFTIGGIEGEINEALAATPAPPRNGVRVD